MLLLKNAHVLDPYTGLDGLRDILISHSGSILQVAGHIDIPDAETHDLAGMTAAPGFIDTHVHFRDPGQTEKEDIFTGAQAAAAGGYTTVVCMANTLPTCDNAETLSEIYARAAQVPNVNILQACSITKGLRGNELTDFEALLSLHAAGFTDDGINLTDEALTRRAMEQAARLPQPPLLSFHEEDPARLGSPRGNPASEAARRLGVPGASPLSEERMVARDIALARETGARVVFQHISSARSVELIRQGKAAGAPIFCEATPHHLSLTEDAVLKHGTLARMNPPLRTEADRAAIVDGLADGTIDMIATDHAPHTAAEKAREWAKAPSGIIGLETAFSVCNTFLVRTGRLTKMQLLEKMSRNPAQIYAMPDKSIAPGNHAELVLLDWDCEKTYTSYRSKASNSPFTGMPLYGAVLGTVFGTLLTRS